MLVFSSKRAFAINLVSDLSWLITADADPRDRFGFTSSCCVNLGVYENGELKKTVLVWRFNKDKCKSNFYDCASRLVNEITSALRRGDKEFDVDAEADKIEHMELLGCD